MEGERLGDEVDLDALSVQGGFHEAESLHGHERVEVAVNTH